MISTIFNTILYRPIFNLLVFIYNILPGHDFGVAIIVLTILIRVIFVPLSIKTLRSQRDLAKLQPKIKELQAKFKNDKQALGQATMALYKEHQVNPFSGCLPLLIQIPILLALYSAFRSGLDPKSLGNLYSFVGNPGIIKEVSLGFINLAHKSPVLAVLAGVFQWAQSYLAAKNTAPGKDQAKLDQTSLMMNRQMLYFFPVMVIIISWNLPTGLVIYWVVTTLFSIGEQLYIKKRYAP